MLLYNIAAVLRYFGEFHLIFALVSFIRYLRSFSHFGSAVALLISSGVSIRAVWFGQWCSHMQSFSQVPISSGFKFCARTCHKPGIAPHKCDPVLDKCPGFSSCGILRYHPEERARRKAAEKEEKARVREYRKRAVEEAKKAKAAKNKLAPPPGMLGYAYFQYFIGVEVLMWCERGMG